MTADAGTGPDQGELRQGGDAEPGPDQGELRERRSGGRGGRRRAGTPQAIVISWRDIPAQITARVDDEQHKVLLHARFQHAIDRAAAVAGLTSTDDYVQQWRSTASPIGIGDVAAQLDQRCAEIEGAFPRERLEAFVANGGLDPDHHPRQDGAPE